MTSLTLQDHAAMQGQGWGIFPTFDGFKLGRFGAKSHFRYDEAAWLHVVERAEEGEPLAMRALAFLEKHEPIEFSCIARYMAIVRPCQLPHPRQAA